VAVRYAFSVDLDRCIGCQACTVACGAGNELAPGGAFTGVHDLVRRREEGLWGSFAHRRCQHCGEAPCVEVCPTGALWKWNGLTAVEPQRCSGCAYCADACPYHVPQVREGEVRKCVACAELVTAGERPWCERTCPNEAIRFGEREAILAEARGRVERLRPRHPGATLYGEAQLGGLGLVTVLLDEPAVYGLPEDPRSRALEVWQVVRRASAGTSAAAALTMGALFVVARRRHLAERSEDDAPGAAAPAPGEGSRSGGDEGGHG
jgi:formate dehydrogenase iron-sulfur subunit